VQVAGTFVATRRDPTVTDVAVQPGPAGAGPVVAARGAAPKHGKSARPGSSGFLRLFPMLPAIVLLLIFFVGPIVWAVITSTTNTTLTGLQAIHPSYVGLHNFKLMFETGGGVGSAIIKTAIFTVACVLIQNVVGMVLALLMRKRNRYVRGVVAAVVVSAWIVPEVVAGFVWYSFLQPHSTLDKIFSAVGLPAENWLITLPMLAIILANGWRGCAFSMLIYSAAVSDIPPELLESASVDGAGGPQRLIYVILPTMRRIIGTNFLLVTLQTLGVFTLIFTMTGGGPNDRSQTLPLLMYNQAFNLFQIGYGNAIALVLLVVGAVFAAFYLVVLRPEAT
jgi:multiple sugar transport system permease protein